jgi:undecaprenyl-diphosphatase
MIWGSSSFDREVLLTLPSSAELSVPIGPAWLPEAARGATSLGSTVVLGIVTLAVAGYLFCLESLHWLGLMLMAVVSGIALGDLLKLAFGRARPDVGFGERRPQTNPPAFIRPSGKQD